MNLDFDMSNRNAKGLIKDCTLGAIRREKRCHAKNCHNCGWNPREIERRKASEKLHRHASGLWGF